MFELKRAPIVGVVKGIFSILMLAAMGYLMVHDYLPSSKRVAGYVEIRDGRAVAAR